MVPFTDGGVGVSLVVSHCLIDGVGLCQVVTDAAAGGGNPIERPTGNTRRRWRAIGEDLGQTIRDLPEIGGAILAAARFARHRRGAGTTGAPTTTFDGTDGPVTLSTATIFLDAGEWDTRAAELGGTSNTLLAGAAARLALRVGRVTADGAVTPSIPVNRRTPGDTRANAITNVDLTVDPTIAATDLRQIRSATKEALTRSNETPVERWPLLPLVPLLPKGLTRAVVGVATGGATNVVSSNLGITPAALNRPDGTDADYFAMKSFYPGASRAILHRTGGVLALLSGRVGRRIFVSALAYQPGQMNSNGVLHHHLSIIFPEYSLTHDTGWAHTEAIAA